MSGSNAPTKKATEFRFIADEQHRRARHVHFTSMYDNIIKACESIAKDGRYDYNLYDERLKNEHLLDDLKRALKEDGFKVEGGIDSHYSDHVGHDVYYINVSWK